LKKQGRGGIDTGLIVVVIGGVAIAYFGLTGGLGGIGDLLGSLTGGLGGILGGTKTSARPSDIGSSDNSKDDSSSSEGSSGSSGGSSGGDDFSNVTDPFSSPDLSKISPATPADLPKSKPTTKSTRPAKSDSKAKKQVNAPANTKKADKPCEWYDIFCNAQKLFFGSPTINPAIGIKAPILVP